MKKKTLVLYILLLSIYIILIAAAFFGLERFSSTSSITDNSPTIIIDAGHGGDDGGAVANNTVEKDINLSISKKLYNIFKLSGFKVKMTRKTDTMINNSGEALRERKVSDMKQRLAVYNSSEDNIVISIHQNKFTEERYNGAQVFYSANNKNSSNLAESIKNSIKTLIQPENNREIKPADSGIYLLNNSTVCSVIVECGFISNYKEAENLRNNEYQDKIAFAVYNGFLDYYNNI